MGIEQRFVADCYPGFQVLRKMVQQAASSQGCKIAFAERL
jgi:hypothetical protein